MSYLLHRAKDLADLEDLVHLTVAREQGPEGVELGHDAAYGPEVYGGAVHGGPEEDLRSAVPGGEEGRRGDPHMLQRRLR